jgi:hypothetical protein
MGRIRPFIFAALISIASNSSQFYPAPRPVTHPRPSTSGNIQMDLLQDGTRTESAELSEFRFCLFQDGAVGVGALPERKELLVLRASF